MDSPHGHSPLRRFGPAAICAALATLAALPATAHAVPQLPDLVSDAPEDVHLQQSSSGGTNRLLLRFDGFIHNDGDGALEIRGSSLSGLNLMTRQQRVFDSVSGFTDQAMPFNSELRFETNDDHSHFHLMNAAFYSLVNESGDLVAPAMKVGFCLADSDYIGPSGEDDDWYSGGVTDSPEFTWCSYNAVPTNSVFMGVSAGWRDIYPSSLAFQWVDVSDTMPGSYKLRAQVDPDNIVDETDEDNPPGDTPFTLPGYVAKGFAGNVDADTPESLPLAVTSFGSPGTKQVQIMRGPDHGTLNVAEGQWIDGLSSVTYTPDPGYSGPDKIAFAARSAGSSYPRHPFLAAGCLAVGGSGGAACTAVSGPTQVYTGTSAQMQAAVEGASSDVTWEVNGVEGGNGTVGTIDENGLYTAPASPPAGGGVTIGAEANGDSDALSVAVVVPPAPVPAPTAPAPPLAAGPQPSSPPTDVPAKPRAALSRARMFRNDGRLYMRLVPGRSGRVIVRGKAGRKRFRVCSVRVRAGEALTCRVKVPRRYARHRVRITAKLVSGRRTLAVRRASARGTRARRSHTHTHTQRR